MNIDATEYPIVRMIADPALDVPVDEVLASISDLLALGRPFVFIGEGDPGDGGGDKQAKVEERRKTALWMKANKTEIRRLVKGHVHIVPEAAKRVAMKAFSVVFAKFWGYPMYIVASAEDARAKAQSLLAGA